MVSVCISELNPYRVQSTLCRLTQWDEIEYRETIFRNSVRHAAYPC